MPTFQDDVYAAGVRLGAGSYLGVRGKTYFVDPVNGKDGVMGTAAAPFLTLTHAFGKCVSGRGDKIIIVDNGDSTGSVRLSETLVWNKDNTHLIGACAPTVNGQRARITTPTAGATFTPLIQLTADSCHFENVSIYDGSTSTTACALEITGHRNSFRNVNVQGITNATAGNAAGACVLKINGGQENTWRECLIGLDTIARTAANATLVLTGAAARNRFYDCEFSAYATGSGAGHLFVKASAQNDLDRVTIFKRCLFENAGAASGGVDLTQVANIHGSAGGKVIMWDSWMDGCGKWPAADNGRLIVTGSAVTANASGKAIAALAP